MSCQASWAQRRRGSRPRTDRGRREKPFVPCEPGFPARHLSAVLVGEIPHPVRQFQFPLWHFEATTESDLSIGLGGLEAFAPLLPILQGTIQLCAGATKGSRIEMPF